MKPKRTRALSETFAPAKLVRGDGADLSVSDAHSNCVGSEPNDPATEFAPDQGDGHPSSDTHTGNAVARPIGPAIHRVKTAEDSPDRPEVQLGSEAHSFADLGHSSIPLLVELWRQRQDLRRAEKKLDLQCQAICRRASGGDKEIAGKLWARIKAGKADEPALLMLLSPYTGAMASLDGSASGIEKEMVKIVRVMPLWLDWAKSVRGMAELSFAGLVGEASRAVSDYRSVSALWKRFGLAVIDGGRQRLIAGAENALLHGYSPQRRAYAYVLSTNLMRSQRAEDPYRALYDRRKAYEMERGLPKAHAHNRALRVMVKRLLQDAWVADRKAPAIIEGSPA